MRVQWPWRVCLGSECWKRARQQKHGWEGWLVFTFTGNITFLGMSVSHYFSSGTNVACNWQPPKKLRTGLVFSMWVRLVVGGRDLWSRILPLLTLPFRISRALYARDSLSAFSIAVKGSGTRQLWAEGLRVACRKSCNFLAFQMTLKSRQIQVFTHFGWSHLTRIEEWRQSLVMVTKICYH